MDQGDDNRFGSLWKEWDERVAAGKLPVDLLREAKDEDLIEILAGESRLDRKYARDIIATEMLNRLHARVRTQHPGAKDVENSARSAHEAAQGGQEAIHHAEGILKATGQVELGAAVSASADASLKATSAAFESAKIQAEALHETLVQSRHGADLAADAAQKAEEGREITRKLEETMTSLGRGEEGRAASDASQKIQRAADNASAVADEHDAAKRE
jgi:hypothetical protein